MKNKDILLLEQQLPKISVPNMDRWFTYAIVETIERAVATGNSIRKVIAPKAGMIEYQKKLKELQIEYSDKDEFDQPITDIKVISDGRTLESYKIPSAADPKSEFSIAATKLDAEYKADIDEYNEGLKFIEEENKDFEPYWVTMDQIPDGLSTKEFRVIFLMLEKPTPKMAK